MTSVAANVVDETDELSCVLIPTDTEQLLLPNVCVAEIVPWRRINVMSDGPKWCLGYFGWRGQTIPVLQFAGFREDDTKLPNSARCLVVMNRSRNAAAPAFYALVANSLPRMVQLLDGDLQNEPAELTNADVMKVMVGTEVATIPNLGFIEDCLRDLIA